MSSDSILGLLLRSLPTIGLVVLGFIAANDVKTRRQWTNFLYSVGQVRADQREDEKKQQSVKWPFFIMAVLFLWLPFTYFKVATRKFEVGQDSDLFTKKQVAAEATPAATPAPKPTPSGPTPPPAPLRPGESAPAAAAPSAPITAAPNAPAAAKTPAPNVSGPGPHL